MPNDTPIMKVTVALLPQMNLGSTVPSLTSTALRPLRLTLLNCFFALFLLGNMVSLIADPSFVVLSTSKVSSAASGTSKASASSLNSFSMEFSVSTRSSSGIFGASSCALLRRASSQPAKALLRGVEAPEPIVALDRRPFKRRSTFDALPAAGSRNFQTIAPNLPLKSQKSEGVHFS